MTHQPSTIKHSPAPVYLLAGGDWRKSKTPDLLLQRFFYQTCVKPPLIAYIGAANEDDPDFFHWLSFLFKTAGARQVQLAPTAGRRVDEAEAHRVLNAADLIFVSGGDVAEGMRILTSRQLVPFLRHLRSVGKRFFGLSAGSIMLAQAWVRWPDPDNNNSAEKFDCLGLAPVLCDTHAEADEWEELHALLRLCPDKTVGYGIPSGGGMVVAPDGFVQAVGKPIPRFRKNGKAVEHLTDLRF